MNKSKSLLFFLIATLTFSSVNAVEIPVEKQIEILRNYLIATGKSEQIPQSFALRFEYKPDENLPQYKCGMSPAMDLRTSFNSIDKSLLKQFNLSSIPRPSNALTYDSPAGLFKIHYDVVGDSSVLNPNNDSDGDGIPDYVESVGIIADSVWNNLISIMGYDIPPNDGTLGGDSKYDIYLKDIDFSAFGYTDSNDPNIGSSIIKIYSYQIIDNDYQRFFVYRDRPLDAVRVTIAHELYHAIQFGIDYTENETYGSAIERRWWMEMSATWMEEFLYDNINDYYSYLPFYYNDPFASPRLSIQQFAGFSDLHPYGGVVFPIYLSEKFGPEFVHQVWRKCDSVGGPNVLLAIESVLDTLNFQDEILADTGLTYADLTAFPEMMSEFALWNFFTGDRASICPDGYGFSEKEYYEEFSDKWLPVYDDFPRTHLANNSINPDHNGSVYIKLDQLNAFQEDKYYHYVPGDSLAYIDTVYWECISFNCIEFDTTSSNCIFLPASCCLDSVCVDSAIVFEVLEGYDWVNIDTLWCKDSCEVTNLAGTNFLYHNGATFVDSLVTGFDVQYRDTILTVYPGLDNSFTRPWGMEIIFQMADNTSDFRVYSSQLTPKTIINITTPEIATSVVDTNVVFSSIDFINPRQYRSVTFVFTPASEFRAFYNFNEFSIPKRGRPIALGLYIEGKLVDSLRKSSIDFSALNVEADIMMAYPNPAVVKEMNNPNLKIQYRVPTDQLSNYLYSDLQLIMNIYNLSGEHIAFIDTIVQIDPFNGYNAGDRVVLYEADWNMKNSSGIDVASGVYLIHAALFSEAGGELLVEKITKAAIIR